MPDGWMTRDWVESQWSHLALLRLSAYGFGMIGFDLAMMTIILPVLVLDVAPEEFKNSYLSALSFTGLIVAALVQPMVGRYSDRTRTRLGRRVPYLLWGCAFVCVGLAGVGFAPSYPVLFGVWLFTQANFNIGYGPYQALIRDLVPSNRIGVASALKILSDAAGSLILIVASSAIIGLGAAWGVIDGRWAALALLGATLVAATAITSVTVRNRESAGALAQGPVLPELQPARSLHPQLNWYLISRLMIMTAITAFPTFGLFYVRDVLELENPAQELGRLIIPVGLALAISVYPAGWLSDKLGRKPVVLAGTVGAALCSAWLLNADTTTDLVTMATVLGAMIGVLLSSNWALANDLATSGREGTHIGIVNLSTTGGSAAAKLLGPGIDLLNRMSEGLGYDALLISCSVLFLLGGLLLLPLKVDAGNTTPPQGASP
jgi:MFS family permease